MADFRRVVTALAVLALLTGFAATASAQVTAPFSCTAQTAVPPLLRAEGLTELVGDIVLVCTGGNPANTGSANFAVFLGNTTITSKPGDPLLLVDEPTVGAATLGENLFQGLISGNSVTFLGVPINPPGTTGGQRVFRITNVRINANALSGGGFTGSQVLAFTSISGSTTVLVSQPQQTVGFVQPGLSFGVSGAISNARQCKAVSAASATAVTLTYTEGFATAFKQQVANPTTTGQTTVGAVYQTESGLTFGSLYGGPLAARVGLADSGTRLRAVFHNIPSGVSVFAGLTSTNATSGSGTTAVLVSSETAVDTTPGTLPTVSATDSVGGGTNNAFKLSVDSTGTAEAVWEVNASDSRFIDVLKFNVWFAYTSNPGSNLPAANVQATVNGSFAPVSTDTSSSTANVPRFVDLSSPKNVFSVVVCQTNLLFPFVTAANGFDTGVALANTTADGGVTTPQSGTCTLNFFGDNAPSAFTTPTVAGGKVYANTASAMAPGFQGYVIAACNFQFGHGFAFVQSTVGYTPSTAAMGYLALVLPTPLRGNGITLTGGATDEVLGQ